jgi:hypothetical protein
MIIERSDPDKLLTLSATGVRLALNPGQIVSLDSEECWPNARPSCLT